jgi:hypothetical protein
VDGYQDRRLARLAIEQAREQFGATYLADDVARITAAANIALAAAVLAQAETLAEQGR